MYILIVILCIFLYIRCSFWNRQPIQHIYDMMNTQAVILTETPLYNKYCDTIHVHESTISDIFPYLQSVHPGFLNSSHVDYLQKINAIVSVFKNPDIQGCIISRKVNLFYSIDRTVYYHEFVYGNTEKIKQTLFQTHEYMRFFKTKYPISIFSTEYRISYLIPVVRYPIQWMQTNTFKKYVLSKNSMVRVTKDMLYPMYELFQRHAFICRMIPSLDSMASMMDSKIISLFYHYNNSVLIAVFIFKNTLLLEQPNMALLDWIGTIHVTEDPLSSSQSQTMSESISTLLYTFRKTFPIVRIHQVSKTPSYVGYKKTYMNHYIYNCGVKRISPQDCLFI